MVVPGLYLKPAEDDGPSSTAEAVALEPAAAVAAAEVFDVTKEALPPDEVVCPGQTPVLKRRTRP